MTTAHEARELRELVEDALGLRLHQRERVLLGFRLGWAGSPESQEAVGRRLRFSQVSVSNLERDSRHACAKR